MYIAQSDEWVWLRITNEAEGKSLEYGRYDYLLVNQQPVSILNKVKGYWYRL